MKRSVPTNISLIFVIFKEFVCSSVLSIWFGIHRFWRNRSKIFNSFACNRRLRSILELAAALPVHFPHATLSQVMLAEKEQMTTSSSSEAADSCFRLLKPNLPRFRGTKYGSVLSAFATSSSSR